MVGQIGLDIVDHVEIGVSGQAFKADQPFHDLLVVSTSCCIQLSADGPKTALCIRGYGCRGQIEEGIRPWASLPTLVQYLSIFR